MKGFSEVITYQKAPLVYSTNNRIHNKLNFKKNQFISKGDLISGEWEEGSGGEGVQHSA